MSKPRSIFADYAVYFLVRVFVCVIQTLSLNVAQAFAAGLAWLAYRVDRRHREVARENLRHAFPEATAARVDRLVRAVYGHLCTVLIEIAQLPRKLHVGNWRRYIEMVGVDRFVDCLTSGR